MQKLNSNSGFTLIELIIIIIIIGIVSAVAMVNMSSSFDTARHEHTKAELDALAFAIVGNPALYTNGARSDFGYVGDIGNLPPDLTALVSNPGGYATWDGPYIESGAGYNQDGWGTNYLYSGTTIRSTGSGANIDKMVAASSLSLLSNTVTGYIVDASSTMPGAVYKDSLALRLTFPDGSGAMTTAVTTVDRKGNFSFSGIPIGNHRLTAVYLPDNDSTTISVSITPASVTKIDIVFPHDLW
ncbi:MAG: prepilin-type N-terminal cleavage/methylation domain-containing protein [candidate division Zixibacteria bacterium]